jgi:hypothetical protein
MSTRHTPIPQDRNATTPGLVGLAHEIRHAPTAELLEQRRLLAAIPEIHDPPDLFRAIAAARLALVADELRRRRRVERRAA